MRNTRSRRIGLICFSSVALVIVIGKLTASGGGIDRALTIALMALVCIAVLALGLGAVIWSFKHRFRTTSARLGRPVLMAMHDTGSGLDQLMHPDTPYRVPYFPGISWTDDALELWRGGAATHPMAILPKRTVSSVRIGRMPAVYPRPALELQINGLSQPIFLVLYGSSLLDVLPMGKSRLRDTAAQIGLQVTPAEGVNQTR